MTLPTSAFASVHIVGSLTSKLPLIIFLLEENHHVFATAEPSHSLLQLLFRFGHRQQLCGRGEV